MDHTIFGLIKKCGEIAGQHKVALKAADALKSDLDAIDRALVLCGYEGDPKAPALKETMPDYWISWRLVELFFAAGS